VAQGVFHIVCAWCIPATRADAAEFYAVAERDGTVALCLSKGAILFADRCEGSGRLSIVQPIKEGPVVWQSASGSVSLENGSQSPQCALSRAKWDPKKVEAISTGRKITKADPADVMKPLTRYWQEPDLIKEDITAFTLDLDNDGKEEIVFVASSLRRVAEHYANDGEPVHYFVYAGIMEKGGVPTMFFSDRGDYLGGTDAIGDVTIKGVVPIAPGTGEIALLVKAGRGLDGGQQIIRYRYGRAQRIDTIVFTCN
jgi:hypothetical protein